MQPNQRGQRNTCLAGSVLLFNTSFTDSTADAISRFLSQINASSVTFEITVSVL